MRYLNSYKLVLGVEFSGEVLEGGTEVTKLRTGDRVLGLSKGSFSNELVTQEEACNDAVQCIEHVYFVCFIYHKV